MGSVQDPLALSGPLTPGCQRHGPDGLPETASVIQDEIFGLRMHLVVAEMIGSLDPGGGGE